MKKRYRIKKNSEIDAIFKHKKIKGDSYFAIYQSDDPEGTHFRFALSIGKKYGNAVARNLVKRRIRMIVNENQKQFIKNKLFVIVIKPQASELSYTDIKTRLSNLFKKSKLVENDNE
ncbi:ribonuclease P protein component [Peloplasma aerotolerans]|uniref:Ribonuclease P protein component n=1 Tax=Peloplasma aerotolerans TaxID=3044389 RepID=A0AAW6U6J8_9MOLU|nr:ribonuclease P protein component [Mariniplasma sp. M4Ah]MDI6452204.1 ribonuclease P protein component [Mariniplasma sp. M4Ah]MDR4968256.1 ribonuclease P protein component [Acholeplasmataceae bacterium]